MAGLISRLCFWFERGGVFAVRERREGGLEMSAIVVFWYDNNSYDGNVVGSNTRQSQYSRRRKQIMFRLEMI